MLKFSASLEWVEIISFSLFSRMDGYESCWSKRVYQLEGGGGYILQFGQRYIVMWTNIFSYLDKYIWQFGQMQGVYQLRDGEVGTHYALCHRHSLNLLYKAHQPQLVMRIHQISFNLDNINFKILFFIYDHKNYH